MSAIKTAYNALNNPGDLWYISKRFLNISMAALFYRLYKKPDVILGYFPLYSAQYFDVSRSNETLKYRAIKGQFMAHQRGGNRAMRIDLTLYGNDQYTVLTILQGLQMFGDASLLNVPGTYLPKSTNGILGEINQFTTDPSQFMEGSVDQLISVKGKTITFNEEVAHVTFNVITGDEVLFDMYIETLIYSRNVNKGKDCVEVHILLRHYIKPFDDVVIMNAEFNVLKAAIPSDALVDSDPRIQVTNGEPCLVSGKVKHGILLNKISFTPTNAAYYDIAMNQLYRSMMASYRFGKRGVSDLRKIFLGGISQDTEIVDLYLKRTTTKFTPKILPYQLIKTINGDGSMNISAVYINNNWKEYFIVNDTSKKIYLPSHFNPTINDNVTIVEDGIETSITKLYAFPFNKNKNINFTIWEDKNIDMLLPFTLKFKCQSKQFTILNNTSTKCSFYIANGITNLYSIDQKCYIIISCRGNWTYIYNVVIAKK